MFLLWLVYWLLEFKAKCSPLNKLLDEKEISWTYYVSPNPCPFTEISNLQYLCHPLFAGGHLHQAKAQGALWNDHSFCCNFPRGLCLILTPFWVLVPACPFGHSWHQYSQSALFTTPKTLNISIQILAILVFVFFLLIFPLATVCNRPPTESHISSDQLCSRTLAGPAGIHAVCEESWSLGFLNTGAHEKRLNHTVDKHAHKFTDKPRSSKTPWSRVWARNQIAWAHDSTLHSSALSCKRDNKSTYSIGWMWGLHVERMKYK